jgi:hypothetical protein
MPDDRERERRSLRMLVVAESSRAKYTRIHILINHYLRVTMKEDRSLYLCHVFSNREKLFKRRLKTNQLQPDPGNCTKLAENHSVLSVYSKIQCLVLVFQTVG